MLQISSIAPDLANYAAEVRTLLGRFLKPWTERGLQLNPVPGVCGKLSLLPHC